MHDLKFCIVFVHSSMRAARLSRTSQQYNAGQGHVILPPAFRKLSVMKQCAHKTTHSSTSLDIERLYLLLNKLHSLIVRTITWKPNGYFVCSQTNNCVLQSTSSSTKKNSTQKRQSVAMAGSGGSLSLHKPHRFIYQYCLRT
jgi:hypothetical protein